MESAPHSYAFLDHGDGRRLERLGGVTVSRPAGAASGRPALSHDAWASADLVFTPGEGWTGNAPDDWRVALGPAVLKLTPAAGGQVGVFPEHAGVCDWLAARLAASPPTSGARRALNLFAHTGLATLRLAALGLFSEIVHVDASPSAVRTARENADASGLAGAPVRWLVDDVMAFVRREARRGRTYGVIVADPPSYGRNKKTGGEWRWERDVPALLDALDGLLSRETRVLCLTCHTSGQNAGDLAQTVGARRFDRVESRVLELRPESGGRALGAGFAILAGGRG